MQLISSAFTVALCLSSAAVCGLVVWLYLRSTIAGLRAQVATEQAKSMFLVESRNTLSDTFKALSAETLQANNRAFLDLAETALSKFQDNAKGDLESRQNAIGELVKPLRESLTQVDAKILQMEAARSSAYNSVTDQLKYLHLETANLVRALRAPATRGRWGEMQLRRTVEIAGMLDHCDFHEQQTIGSADGRLRPDMIVTLPNGRRVVVDAKVSLSAYLDALEATDDTKRAACLKSHAAQIRTHISKLAARSYWAQFESTPDFVIAFLPGESFFSAALQSDPELIEYGVEQRVLLATPTTLIALLRSVAFGWREEKLAQNAQEICELGREVYTRLGKLAENFTKLGVHLDRATRAYNDSVGTLEARVLPAARRIKEKGVTSADDIPVLEPIDCRPRELAFGDLPGSTFND